MTLVMENGSRLNVMTKSDGQMLKLSEIMRKEETDANIEES